MKLFAPLLLLFIHSVMASSSSPVALSTSYRLERLTVRGSAPYVYTRDNNEHTYQATTTTTTTVQDPDTSDCAAADDDGDAVRVDLALHIANRFRVTLCLTPDNNTAASSSYKVRVAGPMMSTRLMPMDEDVQQLEMQWSKALPTVTRASLGSEEQGGGFLRLTSDDDNVEIFFEETRTSDTEEGEE